MRLKQLGRPLLFGREWIFCSTKPISEVNLTPSSPGSYVAALSQCAGQRCLTHRRFSSLAWRSSLLRVPVFLGVADLECQTSLKKQRFRGFGDWGCKRSAKDRPRALLRFSVLWLCMGLSCPRC